MKYNINNLIPEGRLKSFLRRVYRVFKPLPFREYRKSGLWIYEFKNGITIKLHENTFINLSAPLVGYLKEYTPKQGDIIIDAGAFNGSFSIYCSKLVGDKGKIFALEPNDSNYRNLLRNIRLNKVKNIIPLKIGLWSKSTILKLSDDTSLSTFIDGMFGKKEKYIKVKTTTLDSLVKKYKLKRLNLIKMDIEGAEIEAIKGAKQTLKKLAPKLAIASYHELNGVLTYKILEEQFKELGYKSRTKFPKHLTTYAYKK